MIRYKYLISMQTRIILAILFTLAILTSGMAQTLSQRAPLFENWEQPRLLLFFTGFLEGYVEPCGCAGIENMKGGLSRRHTAIQQLERKGWSILPIDAGNLNRSFGIQEELKFNFDPRPPKYDGFIPKALLKKAVITDYLDIGRIKKRVDNWKCGSLAVDEL